MRSGLTRMEALVVLMIGMCLAGLAVTVLVQHREKALREQCKQNMKRIGEAFKVYDDTSSAHEAARFLPPSRIAPGYATWAVLIAPYLSKEQPLHEWIQHNSYCAQQPEVRESRLLPYFCPSKSRRDTLSQSGDVDKANRHFPGALGDYASVAGDGSDENDWTGPRANGALISADVLERKDDQVLRWKSRTSLAMLERLRGKSYTLLIGEKHVPADHLGDAAFGDGSLYNGQHPANFSRVVGPGFTLADSMTAPFNKNFGSYHNGICHFLFADTRALPMANHTSAEVLGELARRGD